MARNSKELVLALALTAAWSCMIAASASGSEVKVIHDGSGTLDAAAPPYNMVCDYNTKTRSGTDNSQTLSAAIQGAESSDAQGTGKRLMLPPGICLTGPQTIDGQIYLDGSSTWGTVLLLKSHANQPLITILPGGSAFSRHGLPNGGVVLSNLRIASVDGPGPKDQNYRQFPKAFGISLPSKGTYTSWVRLNDIMIFNMPSDGIHSCCGFSGFVKLTDPYIVGNGGFGINTNSTIDWVVDGANLQGNYQDNFLSSGDGSLYIHNLNSFTAHKSGLRVFGATELTMDGHNEINDNNEAGIVFSSLSAKAIENLTDLAVGGNSIAHADTWPSILFVGGDGRVNLTRAMFGGLRGQNATGQESENITFQDSKSVVLCDDCTFRAGSLTSPNVTNSVSQVVAYDPGAVSLDGSTKGDSLASAASIETTYTQITTCSDRQGLRLPSSWPVGRDLYLYDQCSVPVLVYPDNASDHIGEQSPGSPVVAKPHSSYHFVRLSPTEWAY